MYIINDITNYSKNVFGPNIKILPQIGILENGNGKKKKIIIAKNAVFSVIFFYGFESQSIFFYCVKM